MTLGSLCDTYILYVNKCFLEYANMQVIVSILQTLAQPSRGMRSGCQISWLSLAVFLGFILAIIFAG